MSWFKVETGGRPLIVAVPSKCGSSSILHWLHEIHFKRPYDGRGIHGDKCWEKISVPYHDRTEEKEAVKVAIHRDGVCRLISTYRKWVIGTNVSGICPDEDSFAKNLGEAMNRSKLVRHHVKHQARWLGSDVSNFNVVLPLPDLYKLPEVVSDFVGVKLPKMPHKNSPKQVGIAAVENLKLRTRKLMEAFVAYDTLIGWDGKTQRILSK